MGLPARLVRSSLHLPRSTLMTVRLVTFGPMPMASLHVISAQIQMLQLVVVMAGDLVESPFACFKS